MLSSSKIYGFLKQIIFQNKFYGVKRGFTLVEVLIATWILGVTLVAIVGLNIGNIKFSRKIDEMSTALSLTLYLPMKSYLEEKYNTDIGEEEVPNGYIVEVDAFDFSSMMEFLIPIKMPIIPLVRIQTPSEKTIEVPGKISEKWKKLQNKPD